MVRQDAHRGKKAGYGASAEAGFRHKDHGAGPAQVPTRIPLDQQLSHTIDNRTQSGGGASRVENTLKRGDLAQLRSGGSSATGTSGKTITIRSAIMAARDRALALPTDDAVLLILEKLQEMRSRRPVTNDDRMAALYLLSEVLGPLDVATRKTYLPLIGEIVGIDPEDADKDMGDLLAKALLIQEDDPPASARTTAPVKPPHWRDALDGIGKIRTYWRELGEMGVAEVPLLTYGSGWSTTEASYEGKLADLGMTRQQGDMALAAVRATLSTVCQNVLPFYVAPPIGALLEAAAATIPPTTLTPQLLPTRVGMFWFGERLDWHARADDHERELFRFTNADLVKGVTLAPSLGHKGITKPSDEELLRLRSMGDLDTRPQLRAIVWHPITAHFRGDPEGQIRERVCFSCYFEHQFPPDTPLEMFDFAHELSLVLDYDTVANPSREMVLAKSPEEYYAPGAAFLFNLWMSTLLFLRQEILRPESTRVENKGARKSLTNTLKREPPEVQIIRLRQYAEPEQDQDADADAHAVEWSCSWMVRGHWHRYRVGPGRKTLEPRYVSPFVKGDRSKPIRVKQQIGVLTR